MVQVASCRGGLSPVRGPGGALARLRTTIDQQPQRRITAMRRTPGDEAQLRDGKIKIGVWVRFVRQRIVPPFAIICAETARPHN